MCFRCFAAAPLQPRCQSDGYQDAAGGVVPAEHHLGDQFSRERVQGLCANKVPHWVYVTAKSATA
jgi:hypothetical protein